MRRVYIVSVFQGRATVHNEISVDGYQGLARTLEDTARRCDSEGKSYYVIPGDMGDINKAIQEAEEAVLLRLENVE